MQENLTPEVPKQGVSTQTWMVVLGCLIFILALSSVILFFQNRLLKQQLAAPQPSPTPVPTASADPTADWKTYTSTSLKLSIKYPSNFRVTENNQGISIDYDQTEGVSTRFMRISNSMANTFWSKTEFDKLFNTLSSKTYIHPTNPTMALTRIGEKTIDGKNAYVYENTNPDSEWPKPNRSYLLKIDENYYLIETTYSGSDINTFDQILSTFKFVSSATNAVKSLYKLILPTGYAVTKETETQVVYGAEGSDYLYVSSTPTVDLTQATSCKGKDLTETLCLADGVGWGQTSDVINITLGGLPAKSFYVSGGVDNAYHIVQTTGRPFELKMYVAGGGLDQAFKQILASFKFSN